MSGLLDTIVAALRVQVAPAPTKIIGPTTVGDLVCAGDLRAAAGIIGGLVMEYLAPVILSGEVHPDGERCSDPDLCYLFVEAGARAKEAEAAQEAPAPEGLRAAIERAYEEHGHNDDWGVRVIYLDALLEALAAPPSPAEPPRPDDERESGERLARIIQEADAENPEWARGARFVLGWTKGPDDAALEIAFQAVRDPATVRAEARPPEGLPSLDLAADIRAVDGNHDLGAGELAERLVARGWARLPEGLADLTERLTDAMLDIDKERPGGAYPHLGRAIDVQRFAADLAARRSARGAEPR